MGPEIATNHEEPNNENLFPKEQEARLNILLSSFNASPKAATYFLLPTDGSIISDVDLRSSFKSLISDSNLSSTNSQVGEAYCQTLNSFGLVIVHQELSNGSKVIGYSVSPDAAPYASKAAALSLTFESSHGFSLYPVFGQTASHTKEDKRVSYTRAKILQYLYDNPKAREVDLMNALDISQTMTKISLETLRQADAIAYDSFNPVSQKGQIKYEVIGNNIDDIRSAETISQQKLKAIAEICLYLTNGGLPISRQSIAEYLPSDFFTKPNTDQSFQTRLNLILSELTRQEVLKREKFTGGNQKAIYSEAILTAKGRLIVEEYLSLLDGLVYDDPHAHYYTQEQLVPYVAQHLRDSATTSIDYYYPYSNAGRRAKTIFAQEEVKQLVLQTEPQIGLTITDIAAKTGLPYPTIQRYITLLINNTGEIQQVKEKGLPTRYYGK